MLNKSFFERLGAQLGLVLVLTMLEIAAAGLAVLAWTTWPPDPADRLSLFAAAAYGLVAAFLLLWLTRIGSDLLYAQMQEHQETSQHR